MPTRRQLIQKITLNANASSVTFSNIPQNYTDLKLELSVRGSTDFSSQISTDVYIEFNGSTSGYSRRSIYADFPSTVGSTSGSNIRAQINLPISTSNTFTSNKVYIPNYNSSQNKTVSVLSMSETNSATGPRIESVAGLWSSSSAISSIKFTPYTGSFVANSTFYLYGITHVPIIRGGEVSIANGYKIHTFKSTASLQVIEGGDVECLIVAGGGGGSSGNASWTNGGGGGGGMKSSKIKISPNMYTITVGSGGAGVQTDTSGSSGGNSSIGSLISSTGGGGGGASNQNGGNGGSGGGAAAYSSVSNSSPGSGISGEGNSGGSSGSTTRAGGGGGGKSASGSSSSGTSYVTQNGANGGAGQSSSISGSNIFYSGGGGSGAYIGVTHGGTSATEGLGGIGGGGNGGKATASIAYQGSDGLQNSGGGGGSGAGANNDAILKPGGNGGSGIVIIRYPYDGN